MKWVKNCHAINHDLILDRSTTSDIDLTTLITRTYDPGQNR